MKGLLKISESAVSQHLKVLREAELIKGERGGYFTHYQVQKQVLKELQGLIGEMARDVMDLEATKVKININYFDCKEVCKHESRRCIA